MSRPAVVRDPEVRRVRDRDRHPVPGHRRRRHHRRPRSLEPVFEAPADLARIAASRAAIATGALLWTVNNVGFVFIALFAWPVLPPVAPVHGAAPISPRG